MRIPFAARAAVVAGAQVRAALQLFIDVKPLEMATAPASPTIQLQNRHIFKTETAPIDPRATPSRLDATFSPTALLAVCATKAVRLTSYRAVGSSARTVAKGRQLDVTSP